MILQILLYSLYLHNDSLYRQNISFTCFRGCGPALTCSEPRTISLFGCLCNKFWLYGQHHRNQESHFFWDTLYMFSIWQGLSYRAQFCPVTITKMWTTYSQNKKKLLRHQKIPHFKSFPSMYNTCGPNRLEVGEKISWSQKIASKWHFLLTTFSHHPVSESCQDQTCRER